MIGNSLIILAFFLLLLAGGLYGYQQLGKEEALNLPENPYTVEYLVRVVSQIFADRQAASMKDMNLSKAQLLSREKQRNELREALRKSAYGDKEAKDYILLCIRDMLRKKKDLDSELDLDEESVEKVICFSNIDKLKCRDKFEIMMYLYEKKYGADALTEFIEDYQLKKPVRDMSGEFYYDITVEKIGEIYGKMMADYPLSYGDKLDIIARRIFAEYKGFGAVDILFDFAIDEIDCGVSGIPKDSYEIGKKDMDSDFVVAEEYSYKSVWIMISGLKIHLSFLGFESQKDFVRVCQNIYKYNAPEMLSRKKGYVISTMSNGARCVVIRPPMASGYCFFVRKFDSVASIAPDRLLTDQNANLPIILMKWLMRGYQNMVISGAMGSGKTTFLKSLIRYLPSDLAIRVYEVSAELNLQYTYTKRNIVALQETESIKMQEELDLGMKLNSDVTIIGEMASKESVAWYVQSARKGSKLAIGTIHTKTVDALISYMRDSLPGYSNERAAEEAAIGACHIDCHLEKEKDHRFLDRITQIVPIEERRYPSQIPETAKGKTQNQLFQLDIMEKAHRETDRKLYTARDLIRYDPDSHSYILINLPTEAMLQDIRKVLTKQEEIFFEKDMEYLKSCIYSCEEVS